ncbi:FxLYD domain-containing protein [Clostridium magnum]|uniref:Zinc-ribbon domain-containing protein n=1 Tax=Clostridium magnum DSM 2767 TaxID=1121326 RepID=A0A162QRU4_9CLOT|nr:FxLYD domain-containing protein [Clostridium magnum]KZL88879.1 hypothetical protein CLMAG_57830 [Clostridium magnum DSM 2767]SHI51301.1 hypothetical protein SAMN02745944_04425 [Clostridium magnum DSM 2767]
MLCSNCGAENPVESLFCNKCGNKIVSEEINNIEVKEEVEAVAPIESDLQNGEHVIDITKPVIVSDVDSEIKETKDNSLRKGRQASKKSKLIIGSIVALLVISAGAYEYKQYSVIQQQNAIKTEIKNKLTEAEGYAKNKEYYKASKTLLAVKDKYNITANDYDGLSKTLEDKRNEYIVNDYYTQALKDIDTKNYSDLTSRVEYLVNFYSDKENIAGLCEKVVKIIEENKGDAGLSLLLDKIQKTYPNNEHYKEVKESVDAYRLAKYEASKSSQAASAPAPVKPVGPYEVTDIHWSNQNGVRYAMGNLKNTSGKRYSYVQVNINLYDENNNQVGSTIDNTANLEDGLTWIFKAVVTENSTRRFKIISVEYY